MEYRSRSIHIKFKIADRNTQPNLPQSTWKIKINPVTQGAAQSEDYLFIPEATTADGLRGTKFCGASAANQIIAYDINEAGYRFNYNVLNNCYLRNRN
ncbi:Uncharacterized protein OBRU01_06933 [Operophtera brumata]|uniref:Uncharacterized protein n=1 Tax=Operophtera brumata TaxID=104452 RepID=A0A0L7LKT6_OPEBR|nr:Uncharacterized protein OBRU01_06933 [Operophtera brumata]